MSPKDSVLATSLPRLRAIETWLESVLPDGMNAHVAPDGSTFRQPLDVSGAYWSGVLIRHPRGGGFHDRSGALNRGDRLLVAFEKWHFDGQFYRVRADPTWRIFWGAEMEAVETALRELTACVAKRIGKSRLFTEGGDREAFDLASVDCGIEILQASNRYNKGTR